jgi:methionyl-tRNA formyltransferase
MTRVVLSGDSSPMVKLLDRLDTTSGVEFPALYTSHPVGREIAVRAERLGTRLMDLADLGDPETCGSLAQFQPDWLLNVNSTQIFPPQVLNVPERGCLNMHPGLLPEYAGLHTHQWAIRNGERTFGATLHWMTPEVDAGDCAYRREFEISPADTGLSLFMKCVNAGVELAITALDDIASGREPPRLPQDLSRRRVYLQRHAMDGRVDWSWSATQVRDFIRAADYRPFKSPTYTPETTLGGRTIYIRQVEVGPPTSEAPGTVCATDTAGLLMAVGHSESVLIQELEVAPSEGDSKPRRLKAVKIPEFLSVPAGTVAQ